MKPARPSADRLSNGIAGRSRAELVAPVYRHYLRLLQIHGEAVDLEALDEAERAIMQGWQAAEAAALSAALGPHRYMGDAQFEVVLD